MGNRRLLDRDRCWALYLFLFGGLQNRLWIQAVGFSNFLLDYWSGLIKSRFQEWGPMPSLTQLVRENK